jgi:propane monooxygenase large subunit
VLLFNSDVGYAYPHRCWSCLVPCLIREDMVVGEIDGQLHTFAHELDKWTATVAFADEYQGRPTPAMGRFSGKREWETLYDGWDLADAIKDLNFVRSDGKTLVPQPHMRFDDKEMWTLDDVRGNTLGSPLNALRAMSPADREKHLAEYRAGFTINPCN